MNSATIPLDQPVQFLAIEWREDGELDHPTLLLEPIMRFSPSGDSCRAMIESAAMDLAVDTETGRPIKADLSNGEKKEFVVRRWNLDRIRRTAAALLRGESASLGVGPVTVVKKLVTFRRTPDGEVKFDYLEATEAA